MSTLKVNGIEPANPGSEDYFLARAWVNFNGKLTVSINDEGNISSLTDYNVGYYGVTFSSALISSTYSTSCGGIRTGTSDTESSPNISYDTLGTYSTGGIRMKTYDNDTNGRQDCDMVCVQMVI